MGIHYVKEIPEVVALIKQRFAEIQGVKEVAVNIRVSDKLVVYEFVDSEMAAACESDLVLPGDIGITFEEAEKNDKKLPRLWLEIKAAEVKCDQEIAELHPDLDVEWMAFLRDADGTNVPLVDQTTLIAV